MPDNLRYIWGNQVKKNRAHGQPHERIKFHPVTKIDMQVHCSLAIAQVYLECLHTYKHFEFEFVSHIAKNNTVVDASHMFLHPYSSLFHP